MIKEKIERSIWPDAFKGLALFVISVPFLLVAVLKFIYYAARSNDYFVHTGNSVAELYEKYGWIKFMWPISPTPSLETPVSFGNIMALVFFAGTFFGIGLMVRANNNHTRLLVAKRKAEEQQLIDDYKK
jgi:hypothetical protein